MNVNPPAAPVRDLLKQTLGLAALLAWTASAPAADFLYSTGNYQPGVTAPDPLVAGNVLQINTGGGKFISGVTLTNQSGTINWNADTLYLQSGGAINNQSLFDAKSNDLMVNNGGAGGFTNSGIFRKSGGVGTTTISTIPFVNSGTIDAQTGTILFNGGNATFNAGSQFTGAGSVVVGSHASFNGALTSANLTLANGNFTGGAAQINGDVNFTGGSLMGSWSVAAGQTLRGNSGAGKFFDGATVTNNGTFRWQTTDTLYLQNGAAFVNNGLHDFQASSAVYNNGGALSSYTNGATGTLRVAAGQGVLMNNVAFVNNGGTLEANGTLNFGGGNATFNNGTTFTGTGTNLVSSHASFNGNIASNNLLLQGGGNYLGNAVALNGTATFAGGYFQGTWTVNSGSALTANVGSGKFIDGVSTVFTNNGTLAWTTTDAFYLQNGAKIVNNGLHDIQATTGIYNNGGALQTYTNSSTGTLHVASGQSAVISNIAFVNDGGTLKADGTLNFNGNNATFNNGTKFTGAGTNAVNSNASFNGGITSSNLALKAGTFTGTGTGAALNGITSFSGGTFSGTWALPSGQVLNTVSGGTKFFDGASTVFTNAGTVNWQTGETLYMQNGATFANQGAFVAQSSTLSYNGGAVPVFNNTGTFQAANNQSVSVGGIAFVNNGGTIQANSGATIGFNGNNATFNNGTQFTGAGTVAVNTNATFNNSFNSANLVLNAGTFTGVNAVANGTTQYAGGYLQGTWNVAAGQTLRAVDGGTKFLDGVTVVNQGTLAWQTGSAAYLQNGATIDNRGLLDVTTATTFVYNGGALPTVANSGTMRVNAGASSTAMYVPTVNTGTVDVQSGTLYYSPGSALTGSGTLQIAPGAAATFAAGGSSVGNLVNNGTLNLGANAITVTGDYNNANFGTGNSFNRRANVTVGGAPGDRLVAAGNVNQGISGAGVTGGTTATPTLTIGNVHVGTNTVGYNIANTGSTGPSLRGAIQTNVNGASLTDARLSGTGVTAGNWGAVAASGVLSRDVTFNVATAGVFAPLSGQSVNILNNFDNTRSQLLTINSSAGAAAYNLAVAGAVTPSPVTLANQRVGGTTSQALTITNTAPGGAYTEGLNATFGPLSGAAQSNSGSVSLLTGGASNSSAMTVRVDTATAGAKTGTAQINFVSDGTGTSGLGNTTLASQNVTVSGNVYRLATASAATPANPVVLPNQRVGGTATQALSLTNITANDGFSERLNASIGGATGAAATNGGSFTTLAAGATNSSALSVGVNTATAGAKSGTATITLASDGTGTSGFSALGIGTQTVNVSGNVYRLAAAALGSLNFGNVLVGSSQTRYVTVSNSALADGFSEGLNAALGSFSGASAGLLASTGGSITNLAAGATNTTTLGVTLNTSASGAVSASVQVLLGSNGATTSGLGVFALPTQNVAIAGTIDALVGNLAAASAVTPNPVNFGNVRVGALVPAQTLTLSNVQVGPAEGLNASISTGTAGLTATGSFTGLAPGATNSSSLAIAMNTATAGSRNGTATVALTSDGTFNGGVTTALPAQTVNVTGGVYRLANGAVAPGSVVLNAREGGVASAALTVSNTAAADGFSEGLRATAGGTTGAAGVAGSSGLVAAGASGGGLAVSLNTATAGAKSGTATINYQSDGLGTSGLAAIAAGSGTVNVSGSVYRVAAANTLPASLNLGTVRTGTVIDTPLAISNIAAGVAGYTETLGATLGTASAGLTGLGAVNGLAYNGGVSNALGLRYTAGTPGAYSGSATVNFASQEINGSGLGNLALAAQSVGVNATVNALAQFGLTNGGGFTLTSGGAYAATLDFGALSSPATLNTVLNAFNLAAGPADSLLGSFNATGLAGTPFSLIGSPFNLAAGASSPFGLTFAPASAGLYTGTIVIGLASHNAFQSDFALNSFTLTLRGQLNGGTSPVPDTGSTLLLLAVGFLAVAGTSRWQRSR